jgi:hypothetical protein
VYEYLSTVYTRKGTKTVLNLGKINSYVEFISKKAGDAVLNKRLVPVSTSANKTPKVFTQEKKSIKLMIKKNMMKRCSLKPNQLIYNSHNKFYFYNNYYVICL